MSYVIFGHDKTAARLFVETMNDSGALFSADPRQHRAVVEERVDQRVFMMTGARMNNKASRLVDHKEIIVFEKDLKRDLLRQGLDLFQRRLGELNLIATSNDLAWPAGCVVESNKPIADQMLES
jgi:hypothetical protein